MAQQQHSEIRKERIEEALKLLDEAAQETRQEISDFVKDRYENLEKVVGRIEPSVRRTVHDLEEQASEVYKKSKKSIQEAAEKVDKSVHHNPWAYLGGATLIGLAAGYFMGRSSGKKTN